jgi:hypothetical protein
MIQLTSKSGAVFGPHNEIKKLDDRYDCDGLVHLPFTVVGDDCVIGEWVPPPAPEPESE